MKDAPFGATTFCILSISDLTGTLMKGHYLHNRNYGYDISLKLRILNLPLALNTPTPLSSRVSWGIAEKLVQTSDALAPHLPHRRKDGM